VEKIRLCTPLVSSRGTVYVLYTVAEMCRIRSTVVDSAGVGVFEQEPRQDQEWIFLIGKGDRA